MKSKYTLITTFLIICFSFYINAQTPVYKAATVSRPAELWNSLSVLNGSNDLNGLLFYYHKADCKVNNTNFLKLVNTNSYAVSFNYKLNDLSQVVKVLIPPSSSVEGLCDTKDKNVIKLIFEMNSSLTEEESKKEIEYFISHITVTKI